MTVEKQREVIRLWNALRKVEGPAAEELRIQILEGEAEAGALIVVGATRRHPSTMRSQGARICRRSASGSESCRRRGSSQKSVAPEESHDGRVPRPKGPAAWNV